MARILLRLHLAVNVLDFLDLASSAWAALPTASAKAR